MKPRLRPRTGILPSPYTVKMASQNDLFSRFVNWLSFIGPDNTAVSREGGNSDLFSRFMNRISG